MNSAHILVVDDNPLNLKLACNTLKFAGHRVSTAANAEETLKVLQSSPVDLILMDIGLPGMDGLTLTAKLKSDVRTKHIPIVVLSAFAMVGDDKKALAAGCDGYITKPIDTRLFAQQVMAYLTKTDQSTS